MLARTSPVYGAKIFPLQLSFEDTGEAFPCLGVWMWGEKGRQFEICANEAEIQERFGFEITTPAEDPLHVHVGSGAEPTEKELLTLLEEQLGAEVHELLEAA